MNKKRQLQRLKMALVFSVTIFFIILITIILMFIGIFTLHLFDFSDKTTANNFPLFLFAWISLVLGTILSFFLGSIPIKPIQTVMNAIEQVANGNYSTRLELRGPYEMRQLAEQFNNMAKELEGVELLRTDFINNFSHEFKTPIVSIRGFAKLLKNEDISVEERNEYLDIIVTESERLTELASNVLELSKLEQQNILTDKTDFNVTEQIRLVIAMMYQKWQNKDIAIIFDSDECMLSGNAELLKQAWINLLDNAIKFSPDSGSVRVCIKKQDNFLFITFTNEGEPISEEMLPHIFDKFYQGDTSHTTAGNGLGLTITAKIISLHNGTVGVAGSDSEGTTFEVKLPI